MVPAQQFCAGSQLFPHGFSGDRGCSCPQLGDERLSRADQLCEFGFYVHHGDVPIAARAPAALAGWRRSPSAPRMPAPVAFEVESRLQKLSHNLDASVVILARCESEGNVQGPA